MYGTHKTSPKQMYVYESFGFGMSIFDIKATPMMHMLFVVVGGSLAGYIGCPSAHVGSILQYPIRFPG